MCVIKKKCKINLKIRLYIHIKKINGKKGIKEKKIFLF